ncbi:hypothetical protein LJC42_02810 [Eubacteriales bacterium OttesenSCG-928-K08]|nr:hypothetical protein [Eubacteriales bacterium OttesenSCG-928-K08]
MSNSNFIPAAAVDLEASLFCGQSFSWQKVEEGYLGCVDGRAILLTRAGEGHLVLCDNSGPEWGWQEYFDMHRDYLGVFAPLQNDKYVCEAYAAYNKIHVLKQPVWETLCSFIISANNNIARITRIVRALCFELGEERSVEGHVVHTFPSPENIVEAGEARLLSLGLGYRAPYLYETAQRALNYDWDALLASDYDQALDELKNFKGVGDKVADCVLLFSCNQDSAFPVDTWVQRVMNELYGIKGGHRHMRSEAARLFGEKAGIVQQTLFHAARMGLFKQYLT